MGFFSNLLNSISSYLEKRRIRREEEKERRRIERERRLEQQRREEEERRFLYRLGNDFEDHVMTMFDPSKFVLIHRTPTNDDTNGRFRGCAERARHIRYIMEYGRDEWKRFVNYSKRWKVEGTFSDVKRLFGDTIRARGPDAAANVIYWIIRAFNMYKGCRKELGRQ